MSISTFSLEMEKEKNWGNKSLLLIKEPNSWEIFWKIEVYKHYFKTGTVKT